MYTTALTWCAGLVAGSLVCRLRITPSAGSAQHLRVVASAVFPASTLGSGDWGRFFLGIGLGVHVHVSCWLALTFSSSFEQHVGGTTAHPAGVVVTWG